MGNTHGMFSGNNLPWELTEWESQPAFTPISSEKPIVPTCREQTDNGSEFTLELEKATAKLAIQKCFSRVKTPKDNPEIERSNETLEYEWLTEYNFNRPHRSIGYLTSVDYIEKELVKICCPVLPMWSASTISWQCGGVFDISYITRLEATVLRKIKLSLSWGFWVRWW